MDSGFDVIVLGVGTMGAAACRALAERGARVLGLEARSIPHEAGSHHGHSRMVRTAYYEHPDYVPLLRRAHGLWLDLNARAGVELFRQTGAIFAGSPDGELVPGSVRSARRHGLDHRALAAADLRAEFPFLHLPEGFVGLWEPTAGYVWPELAIAAMVGQALVAGAEVHGHESVLDWSATESGVRVVSARRAYEADRLVITAGPWAGKMMGRLGVPLVVTRQVLLWTAPRASEAFQRGRFPCWAVEAPDGHAYYGFPMDERGVGLKSARHWRASPTDPDAVDRRITPADEDEVRGFLRAHLPSGDGPTVAARVCLYTNTPDSHFAIGRHPGHASVVVGCGFSGHGFKFAPVIGEVLADLALEGRSDHPLKLFDLGRFA